MKVTRTKSTLNNLHWYSGTKHCLKDYQDAWFFVTVSEVISLKYSLGLVSNKSLEIMPEPEGKQIRQSRAWLQSEFAATLSPTGPCLKDNMKQRRNK